MPLYILAVYSKGEILRPTKREEQKMQRLVKILVRENTERIRSWMTRWRGGSA